MRSPPPSIITPKSKGRNDERDQHREAGSKPRASRAVSAASRRRTIGSPRAARKADTPAPARRVVAIAHRQQQVAMRLLRDARSTHDRPGHHDAEGSSKRQTPFRHRRRDAGLPGQQLEPSACSPALMPRSCEPSVHWPCTSPGRPPPPPGSTAAPVAAGEVLPPRRSPCRPETEIFILQCQHGFCLLIRRNHVNRLPS